MPPIVTVAVSVLNKLLGDPLEFKIGTVFVAASTVWADISIALKTIVRVSGGPINFVPLDGGLISINCIAPTKTEWAPRSLANALNESGDASLPIACIVSGSALATGVTVWSADAPLISNPAREIVWPEVKSAAATVNVADRSPNPPVDRVKVEEPEVVSAGTDPNSNPEGNVTIKLDPAVMVEVAV